MRLAYLNACRCAKKSNRSFADFRVARRLVHTCVRGRAMVRLCELRVLLSSIILDKAENLGTQSRRQNVGRSQPVRSSAVSQTDNWHHSKRLPIRLRFEIPQSIPLTHDALVYARFRCVICCKRLIANETIASYALDALLTFTPIYTRARAPVVRQVRHASKYSQCKLRMMIELEKAESLETAIGEKAHVGRSQLVVLAFRDWRLTY